MDGWMIVFRVWQYARHVIPIRIERNVCRPFVHKFDFFFPGTIPTLRKDWNAKPNTKNKITNTHKKNIRPQKCIQSLILNTHELLATIHSSFINKKKNVMYRRNNNYVQVLNKKGSWKLQPNTLSAARNGAIILLSIAYIWMDGWMEGINNEEKKTVCWDFCTRVAHDS